MSRPITFISRVCRGDGVSVARYYSLACDAGGDGGSYAKVSFDGDQRARHHAVAATVAPLVERRPLC